MTAVALVPLTLWKFFIAVALVLLLQIGAGSIVAHYYAEQEGFYSFDINSIIPYNIARAVHLQSPIVWIGLAWIASALFLAPRIGGREPKGQRVLVDLLFWVTCAIVVGALAGDYLGIMGVIDKGWFWIGNQGLSYLELGRLWQILFFAGLVAWSFIMWHSPGVDCGVGFYALLSARGGVNARRGMTP